MRRPTPWSSVNPSVHSPLNRPQDFQEAIISWFRLEGRDYPWRQTLDPYAILVSEMMLQQTQIATVIGRGYFHKWLELFPSPQALAQAGEAELLRAWEGLGYYNRARNLQKAAQVICQEFGGTFPADLETLSKLPGLGPYTAGAVATFAFDLPAAIVDANICRVLARLFNYRKPVDATAGHRQIWQWARSLVPLKNSRLYNSGLMELGQRICLSRQPCCLRCPVSQWCAGRDANPTELPVKSPKRRTVLVQEHAIFALHQGKLLLHQESGSRRRGLWKLPLRDTSVLTAALAPLLLTSRYTITHHRVALAVYDFPGAVPEAGDSWQPVEKIAGLPMPSPFRRVLDQLLPANSSH